MTSDPELEGAPAPHSSELNHAKLERLLRLLAALPEVGLRVTFLQGFVQEGPCDEVALLLDAMAARSARREPAVKAPMLVLAMLLASQCESRLVDDLREAAELLNLRHLERLVRRSPSSDVEPEARPSRIPDYGVGRELTLGERKWLARRPDRSAFARLLSDPHPMVMEALLQNPRLTEDDVLRAAARRPANRDTQTCIARTGWLSRPRIRVALIHNPGTPEGISVPLLSACTLPELREVITSPACPQLLRQLARELH
ncbi:MAG TPA: hypothetical protein VFQ61_36180, partial [Polyangiaceae bacterium]|nr:hypothetical protein [Polyangiaceae bacterium]